MNPTVLAYLPLVAPIATLIVVVLGVFFSNHHVDTRISDLSRNIDARFGAMDKRLDDIIKRLDRMEAKLGDHGERIAKLEGQASPIARVTR